MSTSRDEAVRREETARAAIKDAYGTEADEYGATQFVSHHLDELDEAYWKKYLDTARPDPIRVLDILELRSHWSDEDDDGMDTFDFTLPGSITDCVVSVRFNESGEVEEIAMES